MKDKTLVALTLIFILVKCNTLLAFQAFDLPEGNQPTNQAITINGNDDGSFDNVSYIISSSGATSGIRYRTSAITVTIGGYTATFSISSLGITPTAGQSQYTQISITKQDILSYFPAADQAQLNSLLTNPADNVIIGANIQIYNAGTGNVLATITNRDDVASVAGNIGFGQQDIHDMETRWQEAPGNPVPPIPPTIGTSTPGGLRPSILVK